MAKKYILRVAIEGNSPEELVDNLNTILPSFRDGPMFECIGEENCHRISSSGGETSVKWGYFNYDLVCNEKEEGESVSINYSPDSYKID